MMINISKKKFVMIVVAAFVAGGLLFFGFTKLQYLSGGGNTQISNEEYKQLTEFYDRYEKLDLFIEEILGNYYQEVDEEVLFENLYRSLFDSLEDEYSMYLDLEEMELISQSHEGEYSGVGIVMMYNDEGEVEITSVMDDSPAKAAGVESGDILLEVEGKTYDSLEGYSSALRGDVDTDVSATFSRNGEEKIYTMTRKILKEVSVTSEITDENVGVIRISTFNESTASEFEKELDEMESKQVKGVVLDLRNNGGGLVDSAIAIADMLLNEGVVVYTEDKYGDRETYEVENGKTNLPIVALANEYSASSSELLLAGLQEQGVKVVGTQSFGKGVIQIISPTTDGDGFSLTINQFFTPSGDVIHGEGITPDYKVEYDLNSQEDNQLEKAISLF